jgi:hypothetical protein
MLLLPLALSACAPPGPLPAQSTPAPAAPAPPPALDADGDGHAPPSDCDDANSLIFPGADERCDSSDNDCDGLVDEDPAVDAPTWYLDVDADGYGSFADAVRSCSPPSEEWVLNGDDCEPTDPDIHPGMTEVCNGEDDDCDGLADNPPISEETLWYPDVDRDGFGDASADGLCEPEPGFVSNNLDCGDRDAEVKPGAVEVCNDGVDNDCSGVAEGCGWPAVVTLDDGLHGVSLHDADGAAFGTALEVYDIDGDGRPNLVIAGGGAITSDVHLPGALFSWELPVTPPLSTDEATAWWVDDARLLYFGARAGHGDVNGDGYVDTVVSAQGAVSGSLGTGAIAIGFGPLDPRGGDAQGAFGSLAYHTGDYWDRFGRSLFVGGDVTGDGLDDIVVGAEEYLVDGVASGAALVLGVPDAPESSAWESAQAVLLGDPGDSMGFCVGAIDLNGDGVGELLVGAPARGGRGSVLVFEGPVAGFLDVDDAYATVTGSRRGALLGDGCVALGDANGDGVDDLALAAPGDGFGWAGVFPSGLRRGSQSSADAGAQFWGTAAGSGGYFGASVHPGGDINQDGVEDLLVGELQWDPLAARVWFGPFSGTRDDVDADVTLQLPYDGSVGYLRQLHGGDDLTGDAVPDILVADETRDEGRVWLVPGIGF